MLASQENVSTGPELKQRVRRILEKRQAMYIGEMRMRLGLDQETLLALLDDLQGQGAVERLRPIGYHGDDQDFFRLARQGYTRGSLECA